MLTPEQLKDIYEKAGAIFDELEADIIRSIARRVAQTGKITPKDGRQLKILADNAVYKEELKGRIAKALNMGRDDVEKIFDGAINTSVEDSKERYAGAGIKIALGAAMTAFILGEKKQTAKSITQIVRNLAFGGIELDKFFDKITLETAGAYAERTGKAIAETAGGSFTYREAIKRAVKSMTDRGLQTIEYKSGHVDRVETAVSRAVLTNVNKAANEITKMFIEATDCDLVEVSAHVGARTGVGIADHAGWQGKVYYYKRPIKGYVSFIEATGYGTGEGLGGYNCRHSFAEYFEGTSRRYADAELEKMKNAAVEYNGRQVPIYEATQKQRTMERGIRQTKREILAFGEIMKISPDMVDENDFKLLSVKLRQQQAIYKDFVKQTELKGKSDRLQVRGFGRSEAAKVRAVQFEKKVSAPPASLQMSLDFAGSNKIVIPKYAKIEYVNIIAGYGSAVKLRKAYELAKDFGGDPELWQKKVGLVRGKASEYDVHWFEYGEKQYKAFAKTKRERKK